MKLPILILCFMTVFAPALAEDGQKIVERKTCDEIKTEIANLNAIENLNAEQQAELKQLVIQQRNNCAVKSSGRRTVARQQPIVQDTLNIVVKSDALTEYLNNKKANCEKLNAEIEKLVPDTANVDEMREMQRIYDMDCVEHPITTPAPEAPVVPAKTDEEIAAEFDANLAAGLCGDGTKPNRYGCCVDEVFRDMGNAVFACCPKSGGDCFPPIK